MTDLARLPAVRPVAAPESRDPAFPAPVAVPPHVVAAIADAAVAAYIRAQRDRRNAERRARYASDPEYRAARLEAATRCRRERTARTRAHLVRPARPLTPGEPS